MKKIFLYVLLNVFIHNEISSRYSVAQDYPFMEKYYSNEGIEKSTCEDLICPESKLTVVQIELLFISFNKELNTFAERNNISNAYKLHWNGELAQLAQNKSGKCLPPTYENGSKQFYLHDNQSQSLLSGLPDSNISLEVVIGERNTSHPINEEIERSQFTSKMVRDFTTLFFSSPGDLASRALNNVFGCGYVYMGRNNSDTIKDRLFCIFGFVHSEHHILTTRYGIACSTCVGYEYYPNYSNSTNDPSTFKKSEWRCDQSFPYLCSDKFVNPDVIESGPRVPYCPIPFDPVSNFIPVDDNGTSPKDENEVSEWPCLPILIPLALLIVIFLAIAIYHFVTALKFRYDTK